MVQISKSDKEEVLKAIRSGHIDTADLALPNLIDTIILTMKKHGFLAPLADALEDKRKDNKHIPLPILIVLAITAKLKLKTSLTDVPFAINDPELLAELGWNAWDYGRDINEGLFSEYVMRSTVSKYSSGEWTAFYNHYVQDYVLENMETRPYIHILDCTKIPVKSSTPTSSGGLEKRPQGLCYCSPERRVSQALLLATAKKRLRHYLPVVILLPVP